MVATGITLARPAIVVPLGIVLIYNSPGLWYHGVFGVQELGIMVCCGNSLGSLVSWRVKSLMCEILLAMDMTEQIPYSGEILTSVTDDWPVHGLPLYNT